MLSLIIIFFLGCFIIGFLWDEIKGCLFVIALIVFLLLVIIIRKVSLIF